jgi:hypothetical protein
VTVSRHRTYRDVAARQASERETARLEADYRAGGVVAYPDRITLALDLCGLYGPDVDRACLAEEPAVDEWEAGTAAPTWEQLTALATLTGFRPRLFFEPVTAFTGGWMCGPCERLEPRESVPPYQTAAVLPLRGA